MLLFLLFSVYEFVVAKRKGIILIEKTSWAERRKAFKEAIIPLGFPVLILGGIYSGIFSPTEAAAVSVAYAFVVEKFIYKSVTWKDLYHLALSTGLVTGTVFILLAAGAAFSWVITFADIPQAMIATLLGASPQRTEGAADRNGILHCLLLLRRFDTRYPDSYSDFLPCSNKGRY